ncbi:MAG: element excision factor XisH family protein [Saprospiraceae bacterium]
MPKKDRYHSEVRKALEKDGWIITHDPMRFRWRGRTLWPDLGGEKMIAAEKGTERIAVEIKSFGSPALLVDFYEALGQYDTYKAALSELDPDRIVILAVPTNVYDEFLSSDFAQAILQIKRIPVLVYDFENQIITKWIK